MKYEEKFNIALKLEEAGISIIDLNNLQAAIYMNDQERVNSEFAWMQEPLESIGITPGNLQSVIHSIETL